MTQLKNHYSRQEVIWGDEGTELLEKTTLIIAGSNILGREIAKSAALLGIGNIIITDSYTSSGETFLDQKLASNVQIALQIPYQLNKLLSRELSKNYRSFGYEPTKESIELLANFAPDKKNILIVSASNNWATHKSLKSYCEEKKYEFYAVSANKSSIGISGNNGSINDLIDFHESDFGVITANLSAGITVEEIRKKIFFNNIQMFTSTFYDPTLNRINTVDNSKNIASFQDKIRNYSSIEQIKYDLKNRTSQFNRETHEYFAKDSKMLVVGCGALGNYLGEMLVLEGFSNLHFIDYDIIQAHNLERQPLLYGRIGEKKSEVLTERLRNISKGNVTHYNYLIDSGEQNSDSAVNHIGKEWFKENKFDIIFGCVDNAATRKTLSEISSEFDFTYVDGGTSPESGIVAIQNRNTACLECTRHITNLISLESSRPQSCLLFEPNINMTAQITASLMIAEAKKTLSSDFGEPLEGILIYSSQGKTIDPKTIAKEKCKHIK